MPDTDIGSTTKSNLASSFDDYEVPSESTDGVSSSGETTYQNTEWEEDYGYYLSIPEFKIAVDTKATWTIGAGYEADEPTTMLLDSIKGNGKDSFNSVLRNMIICKTISEDSYAEVIRDEDGVLINLKPLDSGRVIIVQNRKGQIIRYELTPKGEGKNMRFKPDQIFHLSHQRVADEFHGTRILKSLKWLINARNEAMNDWKTVLHRNVRPMRIWYLDTDNQAEINAFKAKTDSASAETENIYVPKGSVETEIASVAPNQTMNPLQWINQLNDYFFQAVTVPQIIIGNSKEFTDGGGKIVYLAYEQSVKAEQLYIEEQVLGQLNLEINLRFPASLQNELISSRDADPNMNAVKPNDQKVEMEGRK